MGNQKVKKGKVTEEEGVRMEQGDRSKHKYWTGEKGEADPWPRGNSTKEERKSEKNTKKKSNKHEL